MPGSHEPVLRDATVEAWRAGPGLYLDATVGGGGHAEALLTAEPDARLLGCDRDPESLARAARRLAPHGRRVMLAHARFGELPDVHRWCGGEPLAGVLVDLGLASPQLDDATRGLSFQAEGPLDQRMDRSRGATAADWLASTDAEDVARVLREYGDVPDAGRLARDLTRAAQEGRLRTTDDVVRVIAGPRGVRPHPRRRAQVFQAIRTVVNDEAAELEALLGWLPGAVRPDGRFVALAYHSGEDRRIKHALREPRPAVSPRRLPPPTDPRTPERPWHELTRKVVTASEREKAANPRARSVRMRSFRRTSA